MTQIFASLPDNPNVGDTFCGWTWNGSMWVCTSAQFVETSDLPSRAALTCRPRLARRRRGVLGRRRLRRRGASGRATDMVRGGGGSGGYSKTGFAAAMVRGGVLVTVGAGGIDTGTPQNGGATSFGAICVANGGDAGAGANGVSVRLGRSGGHGGGGRRRRRARRGGSDRPHSDWPKRDGFRDRSRRLDGFGRHAAARSVRRRRLRPGVRT